MKTQGLTEADRIARLMVVRVLLSILDVCRECRVNYFSMYNMYIGVIYLANYLYGQFFECLGMQQLQFMEK